MGGSPGTRRWRRTRGAAAAQGVNLHPRFARARGRLRHRLEPLVAGGADRPRAAGSGSGAPERGGLRGLGHGGALPPGRPCSRSPPAARSSIRGSGPTTRTSTSPAGCAPRAGAPCSSRGARPPRRLGSPGRTMSRERWRLIYGNRWLGGEAPPRRRLLAAAPGPGDPRRRSTWRGPFCGAAGRRQGSRRLGRALVARIAKPGPRVPLGSAASDNLSAMPEPLLTGVVVHWRNEDLLAELAAAWPRDPRFELLVVDNGSMPPLPPLPAGARVLRARANLGFAGGANAGIAAARGDDRADPESGRGARGRGRSTACWRGSRPGRTPRAWRPGWWGRTASRRRLAAPQAADRPGSCLLHALPFLGCAERRRPSRRPGAPVEQPAAAALALRRQALAAVGGFDAGFHPAWFEDVDLARRFQRAGLVLRYWPAARFRHRLGSTVPRLGYGPFLWIYYRNLTPLSRQAPRRGLGAGGAGGAGPRDRRCGCCCCRCAGRGGRRRGGRRCAGLARRARRARSRGGPGRGALAEGDA